MLVVVGGCLGVCTPARAEVRVHVEASVWSGYLWGERVAPGWSASQDGAILDARAALGLAWFTPDGVALRGGAVIDGFASTPRGVAGGVELQLDAPLAAWSGWRIGGRLAAELGGSKGSPAAGGGQVLIPGLRLRNGHRFVGLDAMFVRTGDRDSHGWGNALLVGAGVDGKGGAILVSSAALVSAGVLVLTILMLANTTH